MGQLTVYMDDKMIRRIERAADVEKTSISKWVKKRLTRGLETEWPEGYFELFGSLKDGDLARPKVIRWVHDVEREDL